MASSDPPHPPESAEARVRAVLAGHPEALDAWFRWEHPGVFRLCFGFLADATEAEDAAQDAMLHLHDRLHTWDASRPYRAWRNAVVLNLCRDRVRRRGARARAEDAAAQARLPAVLPDPAEAAARGELADLLRGALAHLSPREREAFVLRDLEATPTREVAEALRVTEGTVRSLVTLARRRLRDLLGRRVPDLVGPELLGEGGCDG